MPAKLFKSIQALELEERILNGAALLAIVSVFLPWISGEWLGGDTITYTGFGFYTSFLGITIFLLELVLLGLTVVPLLGGPVLVRRRYRETVRLCLSSLAVVLVLSSLSVLMKVTFEFSRMEVRFGIYFCLVGCLVALFEALLRFLEQQKASVQELFHHPEDATEPLEKAARTPPSPPPPPPPPLPPEEHPLYP